MPGIFETLEALEHLDVRDYRVRGYQGRGIAPLGTLVHHTASPVGSGDLPSLSICLHGRKDLPGPLCQVLIGRAGTVAVITEGYSNHAGSGSWPGIESGNRQLIGVEVENDGRGEPYSPGLMTVVVDVTRALSEQFGRLVIGHKEWTPRKPDPLFDMDVFRAAVRAEPLRPPFPTTEVLPDLERLMESKTMFQLIGTEGLVYLFVPGQRAVSLGNLGNVHVQLNSQSLAKAYAGYPQAQLVEFAARWDAAVA